MNVKNLFLRARTGAVFVVIIVGGVVWNQYSYLVLMLLIINFSLNEYFRLLKLNRSSNRISKWYKPTALAIGTLFFSGAYLMVLNRLNTLSLILAVPFLFFFFVLELFADSEKPFLNVANNVLGILYIAMPVSTINFIVFHHGSYSFQMLLGMLLIMWANDSFAYLTGSQLGKTPLFKRLSPQKTIEGLIGGIVGSLALVYPLSLIFKEYSLIDWLMVAIIIDIFSNLGDLIESMFKRSLNIKDTGNVMPGHGGFLDRFDGLFFSVPFVAVYITFFG